MTDDLLKRAEPFLNQCGSCDLGLPHPCNCPPGDFRPVMSELAIEVQRLRTEVAELEKMVDPCWTCSGKGCSDCIEAASR